MNYPAASSGELTPKEIRCQNDGNFGVSNVCIRLSETDSINFGPIRPHQTTCYMNCIPLHFSENFQYRTYLCHHGLFRTHTIRIAAIGCCSPNDSITSGKYTLTFKIQKQWDPFLRWNYIRLMSKTFNPVLIKNQ